MKTILIITNDKISISVIDPVHIPRVGEKVYVEDAGHIVVDVLYDYVKCLTNDKKDVFMPSACEITCRIN